MIDLTQWQWPDDKKYDVGVVVGRFQVPYFHEGHKYLLDKVLESHKYMMVFLGTSPVVGSATDPMDYITRMEMLRHFYPLALIQPIIDCSSDTIWSIGLDQAIDTVFPNFSVRLYGGRDSFIEKYHGCHDKHEIPKLINVSGTELRQLIRPKNSVDFREGAIYAATSKAFGTVVCTVDIAMIRGEEVLLGSKKTDDGKLRFPGGFVDCTDTCYEHAARRELTEETGMACNDMHYLGSYKINDWRYSGPKQALFTTFFATQHFAGLPKAADDLATVRWVNIRTTSSDDMVVNHIPLMNRLKQAYAEGELNGIASNQRDASSNKSQIG